jgi:hypothetical protein
LQAGQDQVWRAFHRQVETEPSREASPKNPRTARSRTALL